MIGLDSETRPCRCGCWQQCRGCRWLCKCVRAIGGEHVLRTLPRCRASHREMGARCVHARERSFERAWAVHTHDIKQYEHSHRKIHVQAPIDEPVTQHPHSHLPQFTDIRVAAPEPGRLGSRSCPRVTRSARHDPCHKRT